MATQSGLSRRDLMKRSAAAGAVVWATPMVLSSPAFAATAKCSGSKPCVDFYFVKITNSTEDCSATSDGAGTGCNNYTANDLKCPDTTVPAIKNGCQFVTGSHTGTTATMTFQSGIVPLIFQLKPGPNCYEYRFNEATNQFDPVAPLAPAGCLTSFTTSGTPATGITINVTWSAGGGCQGISHMNAYFCK